MNPLIHIKDVTLVLPHIAGYSLKSIRTSEQTNYSLHINAEIIWLGDDQGEIMDIMQDLEDKLKSWYGKPYDL